MRGEEEGGCSIHVHSRGHSAMQEALWSPETDLHLAVSDCSFFTSFLSGCIGGCGFLTCLPAPSRVLLQGILQQALSRTQTGSITRC